MRYPSARCWNGAIKGTCRTYRLTASSHHRPLAILSVWFFSFIQYFVFSLAERKTKYRKENKVPPRKSCHIHDNACIAKKVVTFLRITKLLSCQATSVGVLHN